MNKISAVVSAGLVAFTLLIPGLALGATASSVTQRGVTWVFDQPYTVGQYANGDWWVLIPSKGRIAITGMLPASTVTSSGRTINGAQLNPIGGQHGYDSNQAPNFTFYNADLNVDPGKTGQPLSLSAPASVVKAISLEKPFTNNRPVLSDLEVLTVVSTAPVPGTFRPAPYGSGSKQSRWNESQLDYSILRSLSPVAQTPSLASVTNSVRTFWNEQDTTWTAVTTHALNDQPNYGRDMAHVMGEAMLSLHLNYSNAEKRDLYVAVVQYGLDVYGRVVAGGVYENDGGNNHGRKMPMLLAGLALHDADILKWSDAKAKFIFQDDQQTFYVSQADVDLPRYTADGRERSPYTSAMIGMPEWGIRHATFPSMDGSNWRVAYRSVVGSSLLAHALMAHLTPGARSVWDRDVFFAYMDRFEELGAPEPAAPNTIRPFPQNMWTAYRYSEESGDTAPKNLVSPTPAAPDLTVK